MSTCKSKNWLSCSNGKTIYSDDKTKDNACECDDGYYLKDSNACVSKKTQWDCSVDEMLLKSGNSTHDNYCQACPPGTNNLYGGKRCVKYTPIPSPPPATNRLPQCAPLCDSGQLGNQVCDIACNVEACKYDNGDCPVKKQEAAEKETIKQAFILSGVNLQEVTDQKEHVTKALALSLGIDKNFIKIVSIEIYYGQRRRLLADGPGIKIVYSIDVDNKEIGQTILSETKASNYIDKLNFFIVTETGLKKANVEDIGQGEIVAQRVAHSKQPGMNDEDAVVVNNKDTSGNNNLANILLSPIVIGLFVFVCCCCLGGVGYKLWERKKKQWSNLKNGQSNNHLADERYRSNTWDMSEVELQERRNNKGNVAGSIVSGREQTVLNPARASNISNLQGMK